MTIAADSGSSIKAHMGAYQAIVLVPVCVMLLCLIVTILGCEAFGWIETRAKEKRTVAAGIEEGSRVASGVALGAQKQEA